MPRFVVQWWTDKSSEPNAQNVKDEDELRALVEELKDDGKPNEPIVTKILTYALTNAQERVVSYKNIPFTSPIPTPTPARSS